MTSVLPQGAAAARSSRGARTGFALALAAGLTAVGVATGPAAQAIATPSCLAFDSSAQSSPTGVMSCEVPAGVTVLHVVSTGAGGGGGGGVSTASTGGAGATVAVDIAVIPGETLTLQVGTGGASSGAGQPYGGGGGGWSAILRTSTQLVVAGGGGGGGGLSSGPFYGAGFVMAGGSGGTPVGGNGTPSGTNVGHPLDDARAGFGATVSAAGVGGAGTGGSGVTGSSTGGGRGGGAGGYAGSAGGSYWQGGSTAGLSGASSGGGGGSGYYGGGGGGTAYAESGPGGGGSSYVAAGSATYGTATNGGASRAAGGNGRLQLSGVAPTVSTISPATGSSAGGTSVIVTGANLGSGTTVTVGGQACTSVVVASATSLTCTTGAHAAGAVDVVVTSAGQSATLAGGYTYAVAVPGAPTGVTATAGTSSVTVTWAAPTTGGAVQRYEVRTAQGQAVCTTTTTSCVLGGTAGTAYDVIVVAIGAAGSSSPATGSSGTVTSPVVPTSAPTSAPLTLTTDKGQITTAAAGQEIVVIGSGFAPYSTATIVIYSSPTVLGTVVTDGSGNFSKPVTVPTSLAAGTHNLVASGVDATGAAHTMRMEVQVAAGGATLAATGFSAGVPLGLGLLLLAGGAGLLWTSRRRTA